MRAVLPRGIRYHKYSDSPTDGSHCFVVQKTGKQYRRLRQAKIALSKLEGVLS